MCFTGARDDCKQANHLLTYFFYLQADYPSVLTTLLRTRGATSNLTHLQPYLLPPTLLTSNLTYYLLTSNSPTDTLTY